MAPLIVKDKVIVGVGGGEYGIRGFIAAYDAKTGKEAWRFYTIPGPGEPGHETWSGDAWKTGGGSVWVTGSYDPALNLTYWGIGNPGPGLESRSAARRQPLLRLGRRARRRHRQAEVALPVHAERRLRLRLGAGAGARRHRTGRARRRKVMMWANRNGFFYVLDRATGKFLLGTPFVKVNWASGLDDERPADSDAAAAGHADLAGQPGRHQLVSAVVQPAHRAVLLLRVGKLRVDLSGRKQSTYQPGRNFAGGGFTVAHAGARRARRSASAAAARSTTGPTRSATAP